MKKVLCIILGLFATCVVNAADLVGTASVRMTSDTSANAKTMAISDARRQILMEKLKPYAMADQLSAAIRNAKSAELTDLISETSIDGEKISDTSYSANITMSVDKNAARRWMNAKNIQNWLGDGTNVDMFNIQIILRDPIADWAQLKSIARAERVDLATKTIFGNRVTVEIPSGARTSFTIALRGAGWKTATDDGFMRVWK